MITVMTEFTLKNDVWWRPYHCHDWICTKKWCIMHIHTIYIHINYQIWLVWSQNWHYHWIPIEKLVQDIYTCKTKKLPNMVSLITKRTPPLNSHRKTVPGHIHTCKTKKLPNMVSLIRKQTPPLNSHWKTGPGHISYVPYWIKVNSNRQVFVSISCFTA
jgi:hypothetical protein